MTDQPTKTCFRCDAKLPLSEFYRHPATKDGYLGKCKRCTRADVQANYRANIDQYKAYEQERFARPQRKAQMMVYARRRRKHHPEKDRAYRAVANAICAGVLKRQPCGVCGEIKVQAHHNDYNKPLDVQWLCFRHHRQAHGQMQYVTTINPAARLVANAAPT